MNDELISSVASILDDWNPLGDKASTIDSLEGYKYEAIDILSIIEVSKLPVKEAVSQVITEAFSITLIESELRHYSAKIERLLNAH